MSWLLPFLHCHSFSSTGLRVLDPETLLALLRECIRPVAVLVVMENRKLGSGIAKRFSHN